LLDEDKDNMISYNTINTANLNLKTLKIINPIINQIIEQKAQMITFREFYDICNNYL
jgi:Ca2+-binding EF-hand superfamily protein